MFDDASFTESVTLGDNEYQLSFVWNTRGEFWSMDIADANGNALLSGVRLVISYPLNTQHPGTGLPPGVFFVNDPNPDTDQIEPGRHDFTSERNLELRYIAP